VNHIGSVRNCARVGKDAGTGAAATRRTCHGHGHPAGMAIADLDVTSITMEEPMKPMAPIPILLPRSLNSSSRAAIPDPDCASRLCET